MKIHLYLVPKRATKKEAEEALLKPVLSLSTGIYVYPSTNIGVDDAYKPALEPLMSSNHLIFVRVDSGVPSLVKHIDKQGPTYLFSLA